MKMGILGKLVLSHGGRSLVPSAPKVRQLLALFMLNANKMVRMSECVDELWDCCPPTSATSTLHTYVLEIRRALRSAKGKAHLITRRPGYQLAVDGTQLDHVIFEDITARGCEAVAVGQDRQAAALFSDALALWRGPALADVPVGPHSAPHVTELEENRKYALQQRIEADLRLGRHHELLAELDALTSVSPTDESLHAQFMLALYRSGQRGRALEVFQSLRRKLVDDLGIDPTPRMRGLQAAVANGDPVLDL